MSPRELENRAPKPRSAALGARPSISPVPFDRPEAASGGLWGHAKAVGRPPVWPLFLIGFWLLCLGLLIGPRVPAVDAGYNCVGNVELWGPFGFELNCDSPEFMWLARDPEGLINHLNSRQSRPGLILLAALIQAPLSLIVAPAGEPTPVYQGLYDPARVAWSFFQDRPAYLAYILLNLAMLLASFHVLRRAIEHRHAARYGAEAVIIVATGLLLVANDVTKAFVWSPHTQMLNILVPVLAVYATRRVIEDRHLDRKFAVAIGLVVGIGMTIYPFSVVIPACMLPPVLIGMVHTRSARIRRRDLTSLALLGLLSVAPSALWYAFLRIAADQIFYAELDLKQVVWMKDALADGIGALLAQWFDYLGQLLEMAAPQAIALAALAGWLALSLVIAVRRRQIALPQLSAALPMIAIGLYVSFAVLGFYTCVGWITERLAYPAIPPLLFAAGATAILIARRLPTGARSLLAGGCLAIAMAQIIYEVAKEGPWS